MSTLLLFLLLSLVCFLIYYRIAKKGGRCEIACSLKNKFIIISGASSGLGKFTALQLIKSEATVIFACRNEAKAKEAMKDLNESEKKLAKFIKLDLCDFKSILNFSKIIKENYPKIDILMNNAGAQPRDFILTKDNMESFLEGNFIGHVYLTYLLLDHFNEDSRIINLSSLGQFFSDLSLENVDDFFDHVKMKERYYTSLNMKMNIYYNTKLLMLFFTQFLKEKLEKEKRNIKAVCLHPGVVNTPFMDFTQDYFLLNLLFKIFNPIWRCFSKTIEEGAQTQLYLSYLDYNQLSAGAYYVDCKIGKKVYKSKNKELQDKVMSLTFNLINKNSDVQI